jgi:hypothetical protein
MVWCLIKGKDNFTFHRVLHSRTKVNNYSFMNCNISYLKLLKKLRHSGSQARLREEEGEE